jgi:hypothetical protein
MADSLALPHTFTRHIAVMANPVKKRAGGAQCNVPQLPMCMYTAHIDSRVSIVSTRLYLIDNTAMSSRRAHLLGLPGLGDRASGSPKHPLASNCTLRRCPDLSFRGRRRQAHDARLIGPSHASYAHVTSHNGTFAGRRSVPFPKISVADTLSQSTSTCTEVDMVTSLQFLSFRLLH